MGPSVHPGEPDAPVRLRLGERRFGRCPPGGPHTPCEPERRLEQRGARRGMRDQCIRPTGGVQHHLRDEAEVPEPGFPGGVPLPGEKAAGVGGARPVRRVGGHGRGTMQQVMLELLVEWIATESEGKGETWVIHERQQQLQLRGVERSAGAAGAGQQLAEDPGRVARLDGLVAFAVGGAWSRTRPRARTCRMLRPPLGLTGPGPGFTGGRIEQFQATGSLEARRRRERPTVRIAKHRGSGELGGVVAYVVHSELGVVEIPSPDRAGCVPVHDDERVQRPLSHDPSLGVVDACTVVNDPQAASVDDRIAQQRAPADAAERRVDAVALRRQVECVRPARSSHESRWVEGGHQLPGARLVQGGQGPLTEEVRALEGVVWTVASFGRGDRAHHAAGRIHHQSGRAVHSPTFDEEVEGASAVCVVVDRVDVDPAAGRLECGESGSLPPVEPPLAHVSLEHVPREWGRFGGGADRGGRAAWRRCGALAGCRCRQEDAEREDEQDGPVHSPSHGMFEWSTRRSCPGSGTMAACGGTSPRRSTSPLVRYCVQSSRYASPILNFQSVPGAARSGSPERGSRGKIVWLTATTDSSIAFSHTRKRGPATPPTAKSLSSRIAVPDTSTHASRCRVPSGRRPRCGRARRRRTRRRRCRLHVRAPPSAARAPESVRSPRRGAGTV